MTAENEKKALQRRQILIEEMERVIQENRDLIAERTAVRLRQIGVTVK